jgi:hypothetical protein
LDVSWFKPFNTAFRTYRNVWTLTNKGRAVKKIKLVQWISLALNKALTPNNIQKGFETTAIWPLNPNVMQGEHPFENFKDVQEPTNTNLVVVNNLQVYDILGTFTANDAQETCHYFVDLEGSGANGHSDKEDDESNGGCSWNNNSPEVGSNLGSNRQIQQIHYS